MIVISLMNTQWIISGYVFTSGSACSLYQSPYDPSRPDPGFIGSTKCIVCKQGFVLEDGYCYCAEGSYFNMDNISFNNI